MPRSDASKKELYDMLRRQIEHEDTLVNRRLNWLLLSQAFLFAAFTAIVTREKPINSISPTTVPWIVFGIAITGILLNVSSAIGLQAAYISLRNLRQTWYEANGKEEKGKRLFNGFPKITWTGHPLGKVVATAITMPLIILIWWTIIANATMPIEGIGRLLISIGIWAVCAGMGLFIVGSIVADEFAK